MNKEENNPSPDKSVFLDLVRRTYSPTSEGLQNPSEAVQYKTSRELQYMFRETCEPSLADISHGMTQMGFQGIPKEGTFYWILYELRPAED